MYKDIIKTAFESMSSRDRRITKNDLIWYLSGYLHGKQVDLYQLLTEIREFEDEHMTDDTVTIYLAVLR